MKNLRFNGHVVYLLFMAVGFGSSSVKAQPTFKPPLRLQSAYHCAGSVQTVPVAHGGVLYFASMNGIVHAVDASVGKQKWQTELGGMILSSPVVDATRGQLVVGCDDGHVYALALSDGEQRWQHRMPGDWSVIAGPQVKGTVVVSGDRVFAVNLLGHVQALRADNGKQIWSAEGFGLAGGSPRLADGKLFFTTTRRGLVALDASTGELAWEYKFGRSFSTPTVAGSAVYVGGAVGRYASSNGAVFAIDAKTGKQIWRRVLGTKGYFAGQVIGAPVIAGDTLVVADIDGRILGLDLMTGDDRWVTQHSAGFWAGGKSVGQHIWFTSTGGQLIAIDVQNKGKIAWTIDLKAPLWNTSMAHAGKLYVGTDDGYLLAFGSGTGTKPMQRPPLQTDLQFKHPATKRHQLLYEFMGTASKFQSKPFGGPPKESDLRGKQLHFTFQFKLEREATGSDGKPVPAGHTMQIVSRPLTNYFHWNCSPTFTGAKLDWTKNPRLRVVGSYESPVLNPYANGSTKPRPLCAYIIQTEPSPQSPIPAAHWPTWYVNNWIHFVCDMYETGHAQFFANRGYINWGWDFVEERTMGQFLPRAVWAKVRPQYYLWRAVNGFRQVRDAKTGTLSGVPTTLTIYLSGAHHADPYHNEQDLYAKRPKVSIQTDVQSGQAPLTVKFRAGLPKSKHGVERLQWTFDSDRALTADSLGRESTHTFTKPGKYVVSLTAITDAGTVGYAHTVIEVDP